MPDHTPIASREAALRIALAARALNGLETRALVGALRDRLQSPITETKLAALTVEDLRLILAGDFAGQDCHVGVDPDGLKSAIRLLWGQDLAHDDFPMPEPYVEGEMPGSIRVAVAANRGENLDGHFGSCDRFLVYQVGPEAIRLIAVRPTAEADASGDRNGARAELIGDCQLLYAQSIGGPAAARVIRAGIHPVKKATGGGARDILAELQSRLLSPPPWLARVMGVPADSLSRYECQPLPAGVEDD